MPINRKIGILFLKSEICTLLLRVKIKAFKNLENYSLVKVTFYFNWRKNSCAKIGKWGIGYDRVTLSKNAQDSWVLSLQSCHFW